MKPRLSIVADDRERPSDVVDSLQSMPEVDLTVRRLPLGDFEIAGKALIERKTAEDFSASIVDGRLFRQSIRLANSAKPCALILEGNAKDFAALGMRREALHGALVSLSLVFNIPVLRSLDPAETARLLLYSADQLDRAPNGYRPSRKAGRSKDARRLRLLCALPGIGRSRAQALLQRFGSLEYCLAASAEDLSAVPGIGKDTATAIRNLVGEDRATYPVPNRHRPGDQIFDAVSRSADF